MDIIALTRELGKAIQQDEMYIQLQAARANNDKDESLQKMIEDFNDLRTQLSQEMNQENGDQQKLQQLDTQVFQTKIRASVTVAEAPAHGESVLTYAPRAKQSLDFHDLIDEILALQV